ncbi:MAG: methyltransferase domain-containing protein [Flavipsychrobacter sp.]
MTQENTDKYYNKVGEYFDLFADKYYDRSIQNPVLSAMRHSFRNHVTIQNPKYILDIGCGPGEDVIYFAEKYPYATVYGIDVSAKMIDCAQEIVASKGLKNIKLINTGIENISAHIGSDIQFDIIYVFFGALNTVSSLHNAAQVINNLLAPKGQVVLTFVNKYYLSEFFVNMLKGRIKKATARWGKEWQGYSPEAAISSKTYTPSQIKKVFAHMKFLRKEGYSIFYPAWYQANKIANRPSIGNMLYKMDKMANKTPLWSNGEYTLFVYEKVD